MRSAIERARVCAFAAVGIAIFIGVAIAAPAQAAVGDRAERDRRISISGGVVIAEGETIDGPVVSIDGPATINGVVTDDVFVGSGNLRIDGRVTGDVLVADGNATINGRVGGDVIAVLGRVTVNSGAHVGGDVVSRRTPHIASGTVRGDVRRLNVSSILRGFLIAFLIVWWIAVTLSVAILGLLFVLLFPRAADASVAAGRPFWPALGWGALVGIVGPVVGVLVLVTIVGIPLGLGILSALTVLTPLGYVVASLLLGRTMVRGRSTGARVGAFFAGFGILRAAALIPGIGLVVWFVACLYGLGALTLAAWRAGHAESAAPAPVETTESPAPSPAPTEPAPAPVAPSTGPEPTTTPDATE